MAALLDAADQIARERGLDALSLPAVAALAGASPSSLYHFFPSLDALYLALLKRYNTLQDQGFEAFLAASAPASDWRVTTSEILAAGRAFHDAHPVYSQLLRRAAASGALRRADDANMARLGLRFAQVLEARFLLPPIPHLATRLGAAAAIADCLWAFLPDDHEKISDFAFEESRKAVIGYLSNYLPGELTAKGSQQ
jgi:AcrR family transcriptional regulator